MEGRGKFILRGLHKKVMVNNVFNRFTLLQVRRVNRRHGERKYIIFVVYVQEYPLSSLLEMQVYLMRNEERKRHTSVKQCKEECEATYAMLLLLYLLTRRFLWLGWFIYLLCQFVCLATLQSKLMFLYGVYSHVFDGTGYIIDKFKNKESLLVYYLHEYIIRDYNTKPSQRCGF